MNKLPFKNYQKSILYLSVIALSIACNIPDVLDTVEEKYSERCHTISRSTYERIATSLGQVPETPRYPDSAVYELCYTIKGEDEVKSVRMSEGYGSEEDEPANSPYAGTYIGENLEIPPDWELVEGEFIINIAKDGTVTGSRVYVVRRESVGPTCTWRYENGHTTIISGHISGADGIVTVENDSYTISDGSNCDSSNNHKTYESVCENAMLTISGDNLEIMGDGSTDCGIVFKATKQ